jgi:hypothetical protein
MNTLSSHHHHPINTTPIIITIIITTPSSPPYPWQRSVWEWFGAVPLESVLMRERTPTGFAAATNSFYCCSSL